MKDPAYKNLLTYRYSVYVLDTTDNYCQKFLSGADNFRKRQEMFHAARSSKQCLVEGAMQGTSLKGYIKMIGISRGSYEELLEDFRDIARQRGFEVWDKGDRRLKGYRVFIRDGEPDPPKPSLPRDIELATNIMIDLVKRTSYLFDRQKQGLEKKFLDEGGYSENLYKRRLDRRSRGFRKKRLDRG